MVSLKNMFTPGRLAFFFALLFLCAASLFSFGCQGKNNIATAASPPTKLSELSPEAQALYYNLVLTQSLADQNVDGVLTGVQGLLSLDQSLHMYQNAVSLLLSYGQFDAATPLLEAGVKRYPNDPTLTQFLSISYSESGHDQQAISLLQAFLKTHPRSTDILQELIRLHMRANDLDGAKKLIGRLPPSTSPQAAYFNARILAASNQPEKAKQILLDQSRKTPNDPDAWTELGLLAERENKPAEAVSFYQKAFTLSPQNYSLVFKIIGQLVLLKDISGIDAIILESKAPFDLRLQTALLLEEKGFKSDAERMLTDEIGKKDDPMTATYYLAMVVLQNSNDLSRTLELLDTIPQNSPVYVHALERKVRLHLFAEDFEQALRENRKGQSLFPDDLVFWELEGYILASMGKQEEARRFVSDLSKKYPDNQDVLFLLGSMEDENGNKAEAMRVMEKIIVQNPRNAKALNYIGYTLADENKDLDRALALLTVAVEEAPDVPYIIDSLAWALFRLGRYEEAWKHIQRCVSLGGDEAPIWEHYGDIALALRKKQEAIKGFTEAIKRKPENLDVLEKKLQNLTKK